MLFANHRSPLDQSGRAALPRIAKELDQLVQSFVRFADQFTINDEEDDAAVDSVADECSVPSSSEITDEPLNSFTATNHIIDVVLAAAYQEADSALGGVRQAEQPAERCQQDKHLPGEESDAAAEEEEEEDDDNQFMCLQIEFVMQVAKELRALETDHCQGQHSLSQALANDLNTLLDSYTFAWVAPCIDMVSSVVLP